jgi:hypothetical protein
MPFRHLALLLWFTAATDSAPQQVVTVDRENHSVTRAMQPLAAHVGGRVENAGSAYRHQWPGVYFEAAFKGDRVILRFDDTANEYRAQIDDMPPVSLAQPGKSEVTIAALGSGTHRIRLDKVTESINVTTTFGGFYVPAGNALPAPPPRRRQIEFIGDSGMTGYGARSAKPQCSQEEVRLLTDTPRAFAALTARHYDADYQINAVSGRGLIRNISNTVPELAMSRIYSRLNPREPAPYHDAAWRPQIIVIKLQADFVGFPGANDRWAGPDKVMPDYARAYGAFVADLHKRQPQAAILLWWFGPGAASNPLMAAAQATISDAAAKAGVKYFGYLPFANTGLQSSGCHNHFSLTDHQNTAAWLEREIDGHPEYWGGR